MALSYPRTCRRTTGHHRNPGRQKLSKYAVQDIRTWARTEGFGFSPAEQATMLQAQFPGYAALSATTLKDVLRNQSWADPSYDRDVPLVAPMPDVVAPNGIGATMAAALPLWIVALMVALCINCPSHSNVRSHS